MNAQETELNRILEVIGRIAETTADGDFIYRGEPEYYEKVSSSLWRECKKEIRTDEFDIGTIQKKMLEVSKNYTHEKDEFEILTELQHFGGYTNLIDFTTDSHIALFFACDGSLGEPGRIILLERTEKIKKISNRKTSESSKSHHSAKKYIRSTTERLYRTRAVRRSQHPRIAQGTDVRSSAKTA